MAIGSAIERDSYIYVFDENGRSLFSKVRGNGPKDGLLGFTGSTGDRAVSRTAGRRLPPGYRRPHGISAAICG